MNDNLIASINHLLRQCEDYTLLDLIYSLLAQAAEAETTAEAISA